MERMHEIMKECVEADEAFNIFMEAQRTARNRRNEEMANVGPIKIGDIVEATGYSHRGKKMRISRIWTSSDRDVVGVRAEGRILKKDGTPGLMMADYFIEVGVAT